MMFTSSLLLVLVGCSGRGAKVDDSLVADGDDTQEPADSQDTSPTAASIRGSAQKGPMILGSSISVAAMDELANTTGDVYSTETTDDLGTFQLSVGYAGSAGLTAEGFHFDEFQGRLSTASITLRAVASLDGEGEQDIHISPVTHLAAARAKALMAAGSTLDEAVTQADDELVVALAIGPTGFELGAADTALDLLGGDTDGNAYLFAVSAVFLQAAWDAAGEGGPGDATLQEMLNGVASDLSDDGAIAETTRVQLQTAETHVDIDGITANLRARLDELGSSAVVPDLRRVIDHDLDGIADGDDPDADGDGFDGVGSGGEDCEDEDAGVFPGAVDVCEDGVDQNCSGTDAGCPLSGTVVGLDVADIVLRGETQTFGNDGGALGDINGDGIDDFAVVDYSAAGSAGRAYVYAGAAGGPSTAPSGTITGLHANDSLNSVSGIGDLDGDGIGDLIVGVCWDQTIGVGSGAAYIVSGPVVGESPLTGAHAAFFGDASDDFIGYRVAGIGDIDGDTWPDVAVGAIGVDQGGREAGAVYVLSGQPSGNLGTADASATLLGGHSDDNFSESMGGAGDFDGDGVSDLLVGAGRHDATGLTDAGAAYVFSGVLAGTMYAADAGFVVRGTESELYVGWTVAYAGDVDSDGLDDILVTTGNPSDEPGVTLFRGGRAGLLSLADADASFYSSTGGCFGCSLAGGGDLDGDGAGDVILGAQYYFADTGRAYVLHGPLLGRFDVELDAAAIVEGDAEGARLGKLVAALGDVSDDGWDDLLIDQDGQPMIFLGVEP